MHFSLLEIISARFQAGYNKVAKSALEERGEDKRMSRSYLCLLSFSEAKNTSFFYPMKESHPHVTSPGANWAAGQEEIVSLM